MGEIGCIHRAAQMCTKFSSELLKEKDQSEDLGIDCRIILKYILQE